MSHHNPADPSPVHRAQPVSLSPHAHFAGFALLLFSLVALSTGGSARAQVKVAEVKQVWAEPQIDQWIFQQDGNAAGARTRLDSQMALHVDDIDRGCKLTEAQKRKLQLMGRGDIKRFFDRCDKIKQKFQGVRQEDDKFNQIWQEINPLQMTLQSGLFNDESLFYKSVRHTLSGEQIPQYEAHAAERRAFRHRANVEVTIAIIEQNIPLGEEQRRALIALVANDTKPARKSSDYDMNLIMFQMGRLPEEKLKGLLDKTQWKVVNQLLAQYKGWEQIFRQQGLWPDDADKADDLEVRPAAPALARPAAKF